jgi:hypothetical protein
MGEKYKVMGKIKKPEPVTPIASVITSYKELFEPVQTALSERLGQCIYVSTMLAFDHTDYYTKEMGGDLKRRFFCLCEASRPSGTPSS